MIPQCPTLLAFALGDHAGWMIAGIIALLGLAIGWSDFRRLRWTRIWALASNCFTESIRRRVLLVVPVAILGVIVVVQLQQPTDEQDAIRQTIKYTLFTSSLLVTVTTLILACTSLPREIENRVIFTVVTKPTTRLEIVLGKVIGFSRVSGLILILMGIFIFGYLQVRNWRMVQAVGDQLAAEPADSAHRAALQHYQQNGFLTTKSLEVASDLHVYSRPPLAGDTVRWMRGGEGQYFTLEFDPTESERQSLAEAAEKGAALQLIANLQIVRHEPTAKEAREIKQFNFAPDEAKEASHLLGPALPSTSPTTAAAPQAPAQIGLRFLDEDHRQLVSSDEITGGATGVTIHPQTQESPGAVVTLSADVLQTLAHAQKFYVEVGAVTPAIEFGAGKDAVVLLVSVGPNQGFYLRPDTTHGEPNFQARTGKRGFVITGDPKGEHSVAVYSFHGVKVRPNASGKVVFQFEAFIEKNGDFSGETNSSVSEITLDVLNRQTGNSSGPITITPELNRSVLFDVPESAVAGGDFDVQVRDQTNDQWLGLGIPSLALVGGDHSFAGNLTRSLLILWLLSILVTVIAVFCSTFLSWPIAIVLTLLILFSHWGVSELGDALNAGVGRTISTDLQLTDATTSRLVSNSVESLTKFLKTIAVVLPDVSQYPVIDDIERGSSIPLAEIGGAMQVTLIYGISLVVGAYLILRHKEVAP